MREKLLKYPFVYQGNKLESVRANQVNFMFIFFRKIKYLGSINYYLIRSDLI